MLFTVYEIGCFRQPQVLSAFRLGNPRSRKFKIEGTRNLRLPNQRLLGTWLWRHQTLFANSLRSWRYCLRAKIIFFSFCGGRGGAMGGPLPLSGSRLCRSNVAQSIPPATQAVCLPWPRAVLYIKLCTSGWKDCARFRFVSPLKRSHSLKTSFPPLENNRSQEDLVHQVIWLSR